MRPFTHYTPATLPEALELLARFGEQLQIVAGGTDVVPRLKSGLLRPAAVLNIKRLAELRGVHYTPDGGLELGTLTTLRELTRAATVREVYPCLAAAAGLMASEQVRSFATAGGNLCNAAPSADLAPPLLALDASVGLASRRGERWVRLDEFFRGPGRTVREPDELLFAIRVPPPAGPAVYRKLATRAFMDIAVVGVAAAVEFDGPLCRNARIALGAVAPVPRRALLAEAELAGAPLDDERIAAAAARATEECAPIDDVRAAAWYRRQMVGVLMARALTDLRVAARAAAAA
jgi:carbon-monoxide dehydrogenase medium subunit